MICKSIVAYCCYTVGDNGSMATCNKSVGSSFNYCIAVVTRVIVRITTFNDNRIKACTCRENTFAYCLYVFGNCY